MSTWDRTTEAAKLLFESHQARQSFEPLPESLEPRTIDEAYALQEEYLRLLSEQYGPLAGYKLAYTTPVMQERAGLSEPCAGGILANTLLRSPTTLNSGSYVKLGV